MVYPSHDLPNFHHYPLSYPYPPENFIHGENLLNVLEPPMNTSSMAAPSLASMDAPLSYMGQGGHYKADSVQRKERHTKICTARGVRDRRVRLSIGIAREFFNLQDMLGFDKASKTLGWLLAKSRAAIEELTQSKNDNSTNNSSNCTSNNTRKSTSSTSECGEGGMLSKKKRSESSTAPKGKREMRAKARERARERTQTKLNMSNKGQNEISEELSNQNNSISYWTNNNEGQQANELVQSKSNLKAKCSSSSSNQISEEMYFNNNGYLPNLPLEVPRETSLRPGFSSLNIINLSTEIHINTKPWDAYTNRFMH